MSREPSGITILVDGKPTDLDEVSWYSRAPCGCVDGCMTAWRRPMGAFPGEAFVTADEAAREMNENPAMRKKYADLGFTMFPGLRAWVTDLMGPQSRCPHDPPYGIPPNPEVDGYAWAAIRWGSTSKVLHLAPVASVRTEAEATAERDDDTMAPMKPYGVPLCRQNADGTPDYRASRSDYPFTSERIHTHDMVECSRCVSKAKRRAVGMTT